MNKDVSKIITQWKREAGVKGIILVGAYPEIRETIQICTSRPGLMIGKYGELYEKYKSRLKKICPQLKKIEFIETASWYIR